MRSKTIITRAISETVTVFRKPLPERKGLRILMYHSIGGKAHKDELGLFSVTPELFEAQIKLMSKHSSFDNVDLDPLSIDDKKLRVAVTFDDGYLDNLRVAAPILMKYNIPFTVFVTSDFIRNKTPGFLSPTELRELAMLPGVKIGAHGATHKRFTECDNDRLLVELSEGKRYLEDEIGQNITTLAYPHGATNNHIQDRVKEAGYKLAVCSHFDINQFGSNPLKLSRTTILRDDNERVFKQKLLGDWDWYRFRNIPSWFDNVKYKHKIV